MRIFDISENKVRNHTPFQRWSKSDKETSITFVAWAWSEGMVKPREKWVAVES